MATTSTGITNSIYWLALSLTPGLRPTRGRKLVERFGAIQDIFHASLTELEAENLQAQSAQHIALGKSLELAHDEMAKAVAAQVQIICRDDECWPARLSEIYDPPLVLYARGNAAALSRPGIAIVGTRHPTPYGIGMAERLSCDLATRGLTIFSGMARGVDTAGHRGAIKAKGKTVAVFGTGVDVIYPRENKKIAEGILECGGALISEGAKLTATWEDIWEELPAEVKHQLESEWAPQASEEKTTSNLFGSELS